MKYNLIISAILYFTTLVVKAQVTPPQIALDTAIVNLKHEVKKVLDETNTPALGIAIVLKNEPLWIDGVGIANIEDNIDANENTMFRIASISKMFVALSILKLQEEGKLSLEDKVHDLVPEIEFTNQWEETNPIRIVHLLEHTTGWDGYHNPQKAHNDPKPATLKEGLDLHPHSRTSRWVPGTRFSYCNSGPPVAAYIVQKIAGQQYEDYIAEHFFKPLNMVNTTLFNDEMYDKLGATLYKPSMEAYPYRHIIQRPSGAINSSALEMAKFVGFLLNRGGTDSISLISSESMKRMENTKTTSGAKAGLQLGYGLTNSKSEHKGFVHYGHTGGGRGAMSELAYLPEHGIGHVFFINSNNRKAFTRISNLIRDFETQALVPYTPTNAPAYQGDLNFRNGYYELINQRYERGRYLYRLFHISRFEVAQNTVIKSGILPGGKTKFYPVSDSIFRTEKSYLISLVRTVDPLAGEVLHFGDLVYKPIPGLVVFGQLIIAAFWFGLMALGILLLIFTSFRYLIDKSSRKTLVIQIWPSITTLIFILGGVLLVNGHRNHLESMAEPGLLSMSILLISVLYAVCAFWSLLVVTKRRKQKIGKLVFWPIALLSGLHVLGTIYLVWFGVIPLVTWA